jgi:hypothetical protein
MTKRFLISIFVLFLSAGAALALDFSADSINTSKAGKITSKIFYSKDKFRTEMTKPAQMINIVRMDKKVMWNIMPVEKMYMELPFSLENKPRVDEKFEGEIERKHVGSETIDGHPTKKYLVTYKVGSKKEQVYQWLATDISFPVKTSAVDGSWTQEFKNIKMGPQAGSLFELPKGYKKMQMPGGMNFKR